MEQGIYRIQFHLFENGDESTASKNLTDFVKTCSTDFIYDETYDIFNEYTYKAYKLLSGQSIVPIGQPIRERQLETPEFLGSIWTFMLRIDQDTLDCEIVYGKDSQENTVSILWLIPQYTIITVGEVLNSATAGEFVYTQIRLSSKFIVLTYGQPIIPQKKPLLGTKINEVCCWIILVSDDMLWEYFRYFLR